MNCIFPYPGGKSRYASWIIENFPDHDCFVEVFGGSASVILNKPRSTVEVYNDLDNDLVHFFRVLRERGDELQEWLRNVPYSRDVYERWATAYYDGHRPDDDIERAGRFFYLRYTQFSGKYTSKSGFCFSAHPDGYTARQFPSAREDLTEFRDRFSGVHIENLDYGELIERYDRERTLFYLDPPYPDAGDALYSHDGEFDHGRFFDTVSAIEGKWIVSYGDVYPEEFDEYRTVERDQRYTMDNDEKRATERLFMNYDPDETSFAGADQANLDTFAGADD